VPQTLGSLFQQFNKQYSGNKISLAGLPMQQKQGTSATEEYSYKASRAEGQIWRLLTTGVGKNATDGQCEK
jgi:hypothetical protein